MDDHTADPALARDRAPLPLPPPLPSEGEGVGVGASPTDDGRGGLLPSSSDSDLFIGSATEPVISLPCPNCCAPSRPIRNHRS
jgi:hypothetical protein